MTDSPQLCEVGDSALLLRLASVIDPVVNAQAIAIAAAIRERRLPGVRDVVSTFHSVAVYFDPLRTDVAAIAGALNDVAAAPPAPVEGRRHVIHVVYGGEYGPDLETVAARNGLSPAAVIDLHARHDYRVFMLGFQPGFAYLGLVDPAIASPRRASPRVTVPRGSVGIAGRQTGIYPAESPGGWQIIGRATLPVFDRRKSPPALLAPGDTVTFTPVAVPSDVSTAAVPVSDRQRAASGFTVLRPGLFTTVQDSGTWGQSGSGVPVGGAMDPVSHAIANAAVGNPRETAALEVTIAGPELRVDRRMTFAIAGADLSATLDGRGVTLQTPIDCGPGAVIRFGARLTGTRAYLAVAGGIQVDDDWTGPLVANLQIGVAAAAAAAGRAIAPGVPLPSGGARLRVLPGPQQDRLPSACFETLCGARFTVSSQSNRVGYRLQGRALPSTSGDMISDATFPGAIQVPPSGEPILLMADRQTTGGYPQVAVVITADLPLAGQLAPGDWIEFVPCSPAEARCALEAQEAMLADVG